MPGFFQDGAIQLEGHTFDKFDVTQNLHFRRSRFRR